MVFMSRIMRYVAILAIATSLLSNYAMGQNSGSFEDSTSVINVWLNGKEIQYEAQMSVGFVGDEAIFMLNKDQSYVSQSGQPKLPFQKIRLLLPANAVMSSIDMHLEAEYSEVEGEWDVSPMPPASIVDSNGEELIWPESATIIDGYDADIYGADSFWPESKAVETSSGSLRSYKLLELAIPLFRYNPSSGNLQKLVEGDLTVLAPEKKSTTTKSQVVGNAEINDRVSSLVSNYDQFSEEYSESVVSKSPNLNDKGYVIITTNTIVNASSKLADFVAHKSANYTVSVITESQYGSGSGDTASNNIRAWLQSNYANESYGSGGILYVLLIGDPRTDSSSVPMKLCRDDLPTDYYYAELTGDWDSNNDGVYGTDDDSPEKYFEVYTGRIPYYGTISDTDNILQKFIDYENSTDTDWRRNALLPMVPLDDSTQAYQMGEQIKYNCLESRFITSTRIYEESYGLTPPAEYLLDDRFPATEWSENAYGMVIWQTHGWSQGGSGVISSSNTGSLNDDYPSAVYQGSCMTGNPDATDNLGYMLLKNGAIGTIAASRNGLYWVGQTNFTNTNSVGGIGYQYAKRLAEKKTLGQAIFDSKESLGFWLQNYYVYNLYGDPSMVIMPEEPDFGIVPTHSLTFNTVYGGISDDSLSISLVNNSSSGMSWTASRGNATWYDLSSLSGSISGNRTANLVVKLNSNVESMPVGTHTDVITVKNNSTGQTESRTVTLTVSPVRKLVHWTFDETSGETAEDVSGNGYTGTLVNTDFSTASIAGKYSTAMLFDGTDDYVEVSGFNEDMCGMTISVWLYPDDWNGNRRIIQKGGDGSEFRLLRERGYFVFEIGSARLELSSLPAIGSWTHVAAVYDGNEMRVYYNKELKGRFVRSGKVPISSSTMYIGAKNDSSAASDLFKGGMDELQIFNYAKDESGIEALYNGINQPEALCPYHGAGNVTLITDLEWRMGISAVNNDVYFGSNYDSVLNATTSSDEYKGRQTGESYSPGTLVMNSDYYWRIDQIDTSGAVTSGPVWKFTTGNGTGGITWDVWYNISGNYVTNLTGNSRYPDSPDDTEIMPTFEGPRDFAENYGSKMYGFLIPPETGNYTFWIASDDYSELWLSSDTDPSNVSRIAYVSGYSGYQEWEKYTSQKSAAVYLEAGVPYYVMVLHKEGGGGDCASVAFESPSFGRKLITGEYIMPYAEDYNWGPVFESGRIKGETAYEGDAGYAGSLSEYVWSASSSDLTFSKIAGPEWLTVESDGSYHGTAWDKHTGFNLFEVKATDSNGLSSTAILEIKVVDMFTGENGMQDFSPFSEGWMSQTQGYHGSDLDGNNSVDIGDMAEFANNWLIEISYGIERFYWPFDYDADEVLNDYEGIFNGGASITYEGITKLPNGDGALLLDGVDDDLAVKDFVGVCGTSSRTCMAWIKTSSTVGGTIASWGENNNGEKWMFRVNVDGSIGVGVWGGYTHSHVIVNDGEWHHVAAVLFDDGTPDVNELTLYVDGRKAESYSSGSRAIDTAKADFIRIGSYVNESAIGFFDGYIDEFRLFNEALTSDDINSYAGFDLDLYFPLNESSGSIANDYSLYGRNGGLVNGPVWQSGKALLFDGVDDYVLVDDYVGIVGQASRTSMAWIKTDSTQSGVVLSWGQNDAGRKWMFRVNSDGSFGVGVWDGYVHSNAVVNDGNWHHIAAVLQNYGESDLSDIVLYLDGKEVLSYYSSEVTINTAITPGVLIGTYDHTLSLGCFSGQLTDVRIYNRALSQDEVEAVVTN